MTTTEAKWQMDDPGYDEVEGTDPDTDGDLHYVKWDSTDGELRLWVGQHGGVDECALTICARDHTPLALLCTRAQLTEWHAEVGRMLDHAAEELAEYEADLAARRLRD